MSGQVSLEKMLERSTAKALDRNDQVFIAFLSMVGTTLEDMAKLNQFEPMIAKLESVSNRISREIFAYWSQNKNLKVLFRLDTGRTGDPVPYNSGNILRTGIENTIHQASVSFDDRSTGFVWFFSFLVLFSQLKKTHGDNVILLLDEPGCGVGRTALRLLLIMWRLDIKSAKRTQLELLTAWRSCRDSTVEPDVNRLIRSQAEYGRSKG